MKRRAKLACLLAATVGIPVWAIAAETDADAWAPVPLVEDSAITASIQRKLADGQWSNLARLKVGTDRDGTVWLNGITKTQEAAERAVEMARDTEGVVQVRSHIVVHRDSK